MWLSKLNKGRSELTLGMLTEVLYWRVERVKKLDNHLRRVAKAIALTCKIISCDLISLKPTVSFKETIT